MKKVFYIALCLSVLIMAGCKNDSEQDYLEYLESLNSNSGGGSNSSDENPDNTSGLALLAINELNGNEKFIELYNGNETELDITGIQLRKDDSKIIYQAPSGTVIPPKGFLVLNGNATDYSEGFTSGLSADKATMIQLLDMDGHEMDIFKNVPADPSGQWNDPGTYTCKPGKGSFSRYPDGNGKWYVGESTPFSANEKGNIEIKW